MEGTSRRDFLKGTVALAASALMGVLGLPRPSTPSWEEDLLRISPHETPFLAIDHEPRLVAAVDVYVSDFGEHRVIPDRFARQIHERANNLKRDMEAML